MKLIDLLVKELPKSGGWPKDAVNAIYFSHKKGVTFYDKDGMGIKNGVSFICMDINGVRRKKVTKEEFEAAIAKNDGWIDWAGGECPVAGGALVDVKQRDNWVSECCMPDDWSWKHHGLPVDIIAYRLHRDINSRANDDRLEQDLNECIGQPVPQVGWDKNGLPLVGFKCEMADENGTYKQVEIIAWRNKCVIGWDSERLITYISNNPSDFRPLRTEAEKEREAAIQDLTSIICGDVPDTGMATAEMYAERVYDAGYRKEDK